MRTIKTRRRRVRLVRWQSTRQFLWAICVVSQATVLITSVSVIGLLGLSTVQQGLALLLSGVWSMASYFGTVAIERILRG